MYFVNIITTLYLKGPSKILRRKNVNNEFSERTPLGLNQLNRVITVFTALSLKCNYSPLSSLSLRLLLSTREKMLTFEIQQILHLKFSKSLSQECLEHKTSCMATLPYKLMLLWKRYNLYIIM